MKLEPEVEEFFVAVRSSPQPLSLMGVEEARRSSRAAEAQFAWDPGVKADVRGETVAVEGGSIAVRVYTPPGAASGPRLPLLVFFHGGGWVLGWLDSLDVDAVCTYLCIAANCVVASVGYRLSPESKFPGPVEDCYAALKWAADNAAVLHADADRVAVAGESAGGNLAAAVCLVARDRKSPQIIFQMPIVPITDFSFATESYRLYGKGYGLDQEDMVWFWSQYLRKDEDGADPYASPLRSLDPRGLPPALVWTAELDPLRDEGEAYGERLRAAGVPVVVRRVEGKPHGFFSLPLGAKERDQAAAELRRVFSEAGENSALAAQR